MTAEFDKESPLDDIMTHFSKELERTEDKYDLKKLFSKKTQESGSSFILGNNENNMNISNN